MKALKSTYFSLILFFLFGCAQQIPTHDTGYGLVAIPYKFINTTEFSPIYTYEFRSSEDALFSAKIQMKLYSNDVSISEPIKQGRYTIDTIIMKAAPQSKLSGTRSTIVHKIEMPFEINIYDGVVVLIPFIFEVNQYQENEMIYCTPKTVPFEGDSEIFYSEKLKNRENIEQWEVMVL